jgi:uncharacterized membrane protein YjgN (DUF898 family)
MPAPLAFTGSGAEYFRLWITNLLLTVVTFGIYSAWAKVRRTQYFARNTQLAGASFDFRGNPWVMLRGRLLALVLLVGYRSQALDDWLFVGALAFPLLHFALIRYRMGNIWYGSLLDEAVSAAGLYLIAIPLFTARLSNLAWSNTAFPGLTIQSTMPAATFVRMQVTNIL